MNAGPRASRGDGETARQKAAGADQGGGPSAHEVDDLLGAMAQSVSQATEAIRFISRTLTELKPLLQSIREFEDALQAAGMDGTGLLALMAPETLQERKALRPGTPPAGPLTPAERDFARALRVLTGEREEREPAPVQNGRREPARAAAEPDEEPPVDGETVETPEREEGDGRDAVARGTYARETVQAVRHRLTITAGRGDVDLIALHRALSRLSGVEEVMLRGFGDGRAVVELSTRETEAGSELDARIVDALREEFDIVFKRGGELVVQASSRTGAAEDEEPETASA
ncbi:MAG TPA: hypothetical protein VIO14_11890 [Dehalococcoidia bacterium]